MMSVNYIHKLDFSTQEARAIRKALEQHSYEIKFEAELHCEPFRFKEFFMSEKTMVELFAEPNSKVRYIYFYFDGLEDRSALCVGAIGYNENRQLAYPLTINGFFNGFLSLSPTNYSKIKGSPASKEEYDSYVAIKNQLIRDFFEGYKNCAKTVAMVWPRRTEKSNTRIVAEDLGFNRYEMSTWAECYTNHSVEEETKEYLEACIQRFSPMLDQWDEKNRSEMKKNITLFLDKFFRKSFRKRRSIIYTGS